MTQNLLSKRAIALKPSATGALAAKANALQASGKKIFRLDIGMPGDGWLPAEIYDAPSGTDLQGKYPPSDGVAGLRNAISSYLKRIPNLDYSADEIVCAAGGKDCLFKLVATLVNKGEKVAYPAPYWVSYPDIVGFFEAESTIIQTTSAADYKMSPAQLNAALDQDTKLFIFNQPSNPSGMLYSKEEIAALGEVLRKHPHVQIFEDAIYDGLVYDGEYQSIASTCPDLLDRIFYGHSASKVLAMPEQRVGSIASKNTDILKKIVALNSQTIMGLPPKSVAMATAAYSSDLSFLEPIKKDLKEKRDIVVAELSSINGVVCPKPQGAFYASPDISAFFGSTITVEGETITVNDSATFSDVALRKYGLAMLAGSASGDDNSVRIASAKVNQETLKEALNAFKEMCDELAASANISKSA